MREYVEKMIAKYPKMVSTRAFLKKQIESYQLVTAEDVIDSMTFARPDGERVQSSNISDKTCSAALHFRDRADQINEEVIGNWVKEYDQLDREIVFLEKCIRDLPGDLNDVMSMLVLDGASWDKAERILYMSRKMIRKRRQEAISLIVLDYQKLHSALALEMLY